MRASTLLLLRARFSMLRLGASVLLGGALLSGCTLITDVDREKIPEPVTPPFTEVDAGPIPDPTTPDASPPDALPDAGADDAGDASVDTGAVSGDAGDAG
jgi:hypothetical protein